MQKVPGYANYSIGSVEKHPNYVFSISFLSLFTYVNVVRVRVRVRLGSFSWFFQGYNLRYNYVITTL